MFENSKMISNMNIKIYIFLKTHEAWNEEGQHLNDSRKYIFQFLHFFYFNFIYLKELKIYRNHHFQFSQCIFSTQRILKNVTFLYLFYFSFILFSLNKKHLKKYIFYCYLMLKKYAANGILALFSKMFI